MEAMLRIASALGTIIRDPAGELVSLLRPQYSHQTLSRSFSFRHGHGAFPLHTDTAFWSIPARYLVLKAKQASPTCTTILSSHKAQRILSSSLAQRAIFGLRTTQSSRYCPVRIDGREDCYRYDPNYMKPANEQAKQLAVAIDNVASNLLTQITWTGSNAIVIDNWRCLHGRCAVTPGDLDRALLRIYVKGKGE